MKKIIPDDTTYKTFQDILTGYRLSKTLKVAFESGVFDLIGENRLPIPAICKKTGWNEEKGGRFLNALCGLGFLENDDGLFSLSLFSKKFLLKTSDNYQGRAIEFEGRLVESWDLLNDTLEKGERIYSTDNKTGKEYEEALELYLEAMNDAAKIRACEMWENIKQKNNGLILDAGAGSGAFLIEFLNRHHNWNGIFCDLQDVISIAKKKPEMVALSDRVNFVESNLLENFSINNFSLNNFLLNKQHIKNSDIKANLVILSNLVHCQGKAETNIIFSNIIDSVVEDGIVLVHDFFSDCGWRGALYDTHMMLNTYNGRTYSTDEMTIMLADFEFLYTKTIQLDSGPTLLAASKMPISSEFIS